jgi:uncharacterized surface protein with fasciclin (FAS1) repeats
MTPLIRLTMTMILSGIALLTAACSAAPDPAAQTAAERGPVVAAEPANVLALVARYPELATMTRALRNSGVAAQIANQRGVTLLAPRDSAFAQLPAGSQAALFAPAYRPALTTAMQALVIPRLWRADELRTQIDAAGGALTVPTLSGQNVSVTHQGEQLIVTTAAGLRATMGTVAVPSRSGVVYILDKWIAAVPAPMALPAPITPPPPTATR